MIKKSVTNSIRAFSCFWLIGLLPFAAVWQTTTVKAQEPATVAAVDTTEIDELLAQSSNTAKTAAETVKSADTAELNILDFSKNSKPSETAVRSFENLTGELNAVASADLMRKLKDSQNELRDDRNNLRDVYNSLCPTTAPAADQAICKSVKQKVDRQIAKLTVQQQAAAQSEEKMKTALAAIYPAVKNFAVSLKNDLRGLIQLQNNDDGSILLGKLTDELPNLPAVIAFHSRLENEWTEMSAALRGFAAVDQTAEVETAMTAVKTDIETIKNELNKWLNAIHSRGETITNGQAKLLDKIRENPEEHTVAARREAEQSEIYAAQLAQLVDQMNQLKGLLKEHDTEKFKYETFVNRTAEIENIKQNALEFAARLQDVATGDYADFQGDYVPLYYFTDVPNLMRILNRSMYELRDSGGLRETAERLRRQLNEADIAQSVAQAEVSGLQTRVRRMREELDNATRAKTASANILLKATRRLAGIGESDTGKRQIAQQTVDDRKTEDDANQARLDTLQNEQNGLPYKIKEAEDRLQIAQKEVQRKRGDMLSLATVESEAFAVARDAEPVFYAPIVQGSTDPLKRVFIYTFGNRKIVYLRGARSDIAEAKKIIALLDRPAPQARLTLWTLELNGEATRKGSRNFNESLEKIEFGLSVTRMQIAAALTILRNEINREVNCIAAAKFTVNSKLDQASQTDLRWARLGFYQTEVLLRFGVNLNDFDNRQNHLYLSQTALPDPAGTATLGEALIVLTLANPTSRALILKEFRQKLDERFDQDKNLNLSGKSKKSKAMKQDAPEDWFPAAFSALSGAAPPVHSEAGYQPLTPQQKEIVETLLSATFPRILRRIKNRLSLYVQATTDREYKAQGYFATKEIDNDLRKLGLPGARRTELLPDIKKSLSRAQANSQKLSVGQVQDDVEQLRFLLKWLWTQADLKDNRQINLELEEITETACTLSKKPANFWNQSNDNDIKEFNEFKDQILAAGLQINERIKFLEYRLGREKPLTTANARVARVDLMLKQMIDAVDEDLNRHFIQPALIALRTKLIEGKGISVGIVNRTSMLSTNRLSARVDGRSSAQLAVGEEQDVLAGIQQLANIYLATKTGGAFGALGAVGGLPNKDPREIYGLSSGSVFKVTPIFDPTGQTLRFNFDFVHANQVQEPNGSINPQLPRIERHTVNTEVELNNMELREVSRFNTNARIGVPITKTGGIPLIKDIPGMNKIPLLGWFVRRGGSDAMIQESVMFGQTTMYPTIGDLYELLHGSDYEELGDEEKSFDNQIEPRPASNPQ